MKNVFYGMGVVTMVLGMVACGDSVSSANNENADKESSSSVISEDASSSSVKPGSSSSAPESHSNSSSVNSSSSIESSSSVDISSSSSVPANSSSSSAMDEESSSGSHGLFDMTKDEFLNPKISYGEMTDTRNGKVYKTVKIGDQVWMAENLNYDYNKGTAKSYCYENNEANCDVTGRLYTWAAAIDSIALANDAVDPQTCGYGKTCTLPAVVQGVCPSGWHLPTYDEWQTLFEAVGGSSAAGKALKSGCGWYSNGNGTDTYGFSALPAGGSINSVHFYYAGNYASFWSASQNEGNSGYAYGMYLSYIYEYASMNDIYKNLGYSVRCLQNN